jgi:hypothetical protein
MNARSAPGTAEDEGVLSVSELDGLLTVRWSVQPVTIMPSRRSPAMWGDFEPTYLENVASR